ncbi:MAG: GNAT family N-acetyltransferase [Saprospiraceae bacterium]
MPQYLHFETERLILRPTAEEDAAFILELLNTPKALKYVGDRNVHTVEEAKKYIADRITPQLERLGYANYVAIRKSDGEKLGVCGLFDRPGVEGVDIGFSFLPQHEKQGYAYEAAARVMQAGIESFGLTTIHGYTVEANTDSRRLLEKLGLVYCDMFRFPDDDEDVLHFLWKSPQP